MRLDWRELKAARQLRQERLRLKECKRELAAARLTLEYERNPLRQLKGKAEEMIAGRLAQALVQIVDQRLKDAMAALQGEALAEIKLEAISDELSRTVVFTAHLPAITNRFDVDSRVLEGRL